MALVVAWGLGTLVAVVGESLVSIDLVPTAVLGSGAALVGVAAGLAALAVGLARVRTEPGFLVLGASIFRVLTGLIMGILVQRTAGAPAQPFWMSFLIVLTAVLVAEVAASRRLLDPAAAPKELTRS